MFEPRFFSASTFAVSRFQRIRHFQKFLWARPRLPRSLVRRPKPTTELPIEVDLVLSGCELCSISKLYSRKGSRPQAIANEKSLRVLRKGTLAWNKWLHNKRDTSSEGIPADHTLDFTNAQLDGIDLRGADLYCANFRSASLCGANFTNADLTATDFEGAILRKAELAWTKLFEANLRSADLSGADLTFSFVCDADLSNAVLRGADLSSTHFGGTRLPGANLQETEMIGTTFERCDLGDADLAGAILGSTGFIDIDLRMVKGLDDTIHSGPSTIGIDSLYRSEGKIPENFLKGAGLPEVLVTYIPSLVGSAIQFYSCFLSHSTKDKSFCDRLSTHLRARHVRVWYFPDDARWGRSLWPEIDRGIRFFDKLIVVCSENSLESPAVLREIERALQREDREKKEVLFPLQIDNYLFEKWDHPRKADLIARVVGDFRDWNSDPARFLAALDRLVESLGVYDATQVSPSFP